MELLDWRIVVSKDQVTHVHLQRVQASHRDGAPRLSPETTLNLHQVSLQLIRHSRVAHCQGLFMIDSPKINNTLALNIVSIFQFPEWICCRSRKIKKCQTSKCCGHQKSQHLSKRLRQYYKSISFYFSARQISQSVWWWHRLQPSLIFFRLAGARLSGALYGASVN